MSRFRVLWVSLLGLALVRCTVPSLEDLWREKGFCAVGDEDCGMLRIRVDAQGFEPGCLRITAREAERDAVLTMTVPYRGMARAGRPLTQGFSPPKDWGLQGTVLVDAFEQGCDGAAVANQQLGFVLREGDVSDLAFSLRATDADGDGYVSAGSGGTDCNDTRAEVNPGAAELCNRQDDNCDGVSDEGMHEGEPCIASNECTGVIACGQGGATICSTPAAQFAWVDEDHDGHGDLSKGQVTVCSSALPPNRLPTTAPHDDCLDTNAGVYPGVPERCNGLDDNCNGDRDEGFFVGTSCVDNGSGCHGARACDATGTGTLCQLPATFPTWYPDDDEDSFGQTDAGVVACAPPNETFVSQSGDCDDGNPFIHQGERELCDSQDNNCDGTVDEGTCAQGSPRWSGQNIGDGGVRWYGVSQYPDGGVWIVGSQAARAVKRPGETAFTLMNDACTSTSTPSDILSVWAHPNGYAFMMGNDTGLIMYHSNAGGCGTRRLLVGSASYGSAIHGFASGFAADLHGVSTDSNSPDASVSGVFQVDGGTPPYIVTRVVGQGPLRSLHGQSLDTMFAVGGGDAGVIYRYSKDATNWIADTTVPASPPLVDVRVVNSRLAYAVGHEGTLLAWNGASWSRLGSPSGENLTDVLAFGKNAIYVLSDKGKVYRYNGRQWTSQPFVGPVYDIEGTNPEDIWIVGYPGIVFHYPAWPQ
ncbi:MopE-related protein [Corallococcus exercitus]|uniref:MopE-related protein n=1 Tax=Corallococcus exercitus TaxID=2316736 RepID=UPI0035D46EEB